jgi:hypothetical protein
VRKNLIILPLSLTALIYSCSEVTPDYTIVQTGDICRIDDKNVIFTARILNRADPIEEYGFKWHLVTPENIAPPTCYVTYHGEPDGDYFESTISSGMRADTSYNLQAYVKTSQGISYGRTITLHSFGSEAAEAYGFIPNTASLGDTITIWGKYFGYNKLETVVWCLKTDLSSGVPLKIIKLTTDTILATVTSMPTFSEGYLNVAVLNPPIRVPGILYFE